MFELQVVVLVSLSSCDHTLHEDELERSRQRSRQYLVSSVYLELYEFSHALQP